MPAAKVTVEANFSKPIGEAQVEKAKAPEISADMTAVGALEAELAALKRHTERLQQENVTIQRTLATKEAQVCDLPHLPQLQPLPQIRSPPLPSPLQHLRSIASAGIGAILEGAHLPPEVASDLKASKNSKAAGDWRTSGVDSIATMLNRVKKARNSGTILRAISAISDGPSILYRRRRANPFSKTRTPSCTRW